MKKSGPKSFLYSYKKTVILIFFKYFLCAAEWHSRGQRFDPAYLHQKSTEIFTISVLFYNFFGRIIFPHILRSEYVRNGVFYYVFSTHKWWLFWLFFVKFPNLKKIFLPESWNYRNSCIPNLFDCWLPRKLELSFMSISKSDLILFSLFGIIVSLYFQVFSFRCDFLCPKSRK